MSSGEGGSYLIPNVGVNIFTYFVNVLKHSYVTVWKLVTVLTFYQYLNMNFSVGRSWNDYPSLLSERLLSCLLSLDARFCLPKEQELFKKLLLLGRV